jgi:uracil-DNA glycosylase
MSGHPGAEEFLPDRLTIPSLREAVNGCRGCPLWEPATQAVLGAGAHDADVMFVGEQPGDREDVEGEPFVGPAGRELDDGLRRAGIPRDEVYVTNVVKHFKFAPRGRRRLHQKPDPDEIEACLPWLEAEISAVRPEIVVALGPTAAKTLVGSGFRVTKQRGELHPGPAGTVVTATVHPSSILRVPTDEDRREAREAFVKDLVRVADVIREGVAAGLRRQTRSELYERSRELDVPGRSLMNKSDLAEEIARRIAG